MTSEIGDMKPRDLWFGLFKLAITMTLGLLIVAMLLTSIFDFGGEKLSSVVINALIFAFSVTVLATGVRSILSIFDWFQDRRVKREKQNG